MQNVQYSMNLAGLLNEVMESMIRQAAMLHSHMVLKIQLDKERKQLRDMPQYLLDDMGITREQAEQEALRRNIPIGR